MHMKPQKTKGRADVLPIKGKQPTKVTREDLLEIQKAQGETERLQALLSKAQTEVQLLPLAVERAQRAQASAAQRVWAKYGMTDKDSFHPETLEIIRGGAEAPVPEPKQEDAKVEG